MRTFSPDSTRVSESSQPYINASVAESLLRFRPVVKRALELDASALIMVHNHPSGDPEPSRADIEMTNQVKEAAAKLDIVLHDHLVIGRDRHVSFRSEGLL